MNVQVLFIKNKQNFVILLLQHRLVESCLLVKETHTSLSVVFKCSVTDHIKADLYCLCPVRRLSGQPHWDWNEAKRSRETTRTPQCLITVSFLQKPTTEQFPSMCHRLRGPPFFHLRELAVVMLMQTWVIEYWVISSSYFSSDFRKKPTFHHHISSSSG